MTENDETTSPRSHSSYSKGERITSLEEFASRLESRKPFYWRHKFMAAGFIEQWSVIMIKLAIKRGDLFCADKNA